MLHSTFSTLRPIAICLLAGTFCVAMFGTAGGQVVEPPPLVEPPPALGPAPPVGPAPPIGPTSPIEPPTAVEPAAPQGPAVTPQPSEGPPPVAPFLDEEPAVRPPEPPTVLEPPTVPEPPDMSDLSSMLASRSPIVRLASVPNMFGDSLGGQLTVCDFAGCRVIDIPAPGGSRRVKISENDKALPMDRVFFSYQHFHNALDATAPSQITRSYSIDQYTLGVEKTFCSGRSSVELRLPLSDNPRYSAVDLTAGGGDVGNLELTLKRLLYMSQSGVIGAGIGIDVPTGSDVMGQAQVSSYTLFNDAVHLSPFVGFLTMPGERLFCQGFLQVDVATNGNRVVFGNNDLGRVSEQDLLYVDLSLGYWLCRNPCAPCLTGLAPILEYHYTTTLEDADSVSGFDGYQLLEFGNLYNRMDISNVTAGLHAEMGQTTVRVGGVFPLRSGSNRLYDAEIQVSVNRQF